jgi:membrane-bound metal-dependent hydrolase YbcI (DUF457 family)
MTPLEHGLYGGALVFKNKPQLYLVAFAAGIMLDMSLLAVPYALCMRKIGQLLLQKDRNDEDTPEVVYTLYDFSHSFVTALILFASLSLVKKEWSVLALGYGLHIACDIPFHDNRFSTRFLYPISTFHIHGYSLCRA